MHCHEGSSDVFCALRIFLNLELITYYCGFMSSLSLSPQYDIPIGFERLIHLLYCRHSILSFFIHVVFVTDEWCIDFDPSVQCS